MQFNTKTKKLTLTKREQETLVNAKGIISDAGRILGRRDVEEVAGTVGVAMLMVFGIDKATSPSGPGVSSPSGDTSDPFPPSAPVKGAKP